MKIFVLILALMAGPLTAQQQVPQSAAQMQLSFVPLVKEATPAVVNIYAKIMTQPATHPAAARSIFRAVLS